MTLQSNAYAQTGSSPMSFAKAAIVTDWPLPHTARAFDPKLGAAAGLSAAPQIGPVDSTAVWEGEGQTQAVLGEHIQAEPLESDLQAHGVIIPAEPAPPKTPTDVKRLEVAFQVLNAMDAATTVVCLQRSDCHETNPVYGRHPKPIVVVGAKSALAGLHYWVMRSIAPEHPDIARIFGWFTVTVQGGVVGFNMTQLL